MHVAAQICADLNVYSCCLNAHSSHGLMGSIQNRSFKEYWLSKEKEERYSSFDARQCAQCIYHSQNKLINNILEAKPHRNFI